MPWLRSLACGTDICVPGQEEDKPPDTYSESAWRMVKNSAWVVWDGAVASPVCSLASAGLLTQDESVSARGHRNGICGRSLCRFSRVERLAIPVDY
jgi:hypothetical protein